MKKVEPATFIWATALGSPQRVAWLKENYNKPVTEAEYVEFEKSLPHDHPKAANCRSNAKRRYAYLNARFGFFGPTARAE